MRDDNHMPLPGIEMGDCGEKIGFQAVDNGYIKFNHFRCPKSSLLNRLGDMDDAGNYSSPIESKGKRFGMLLACLSGG